MRNWSSCVWHVRKGLGDVQNVGVMSGREGSACLGAGRLRRGALELCGRCSTREEGPSGLLGV